MLVSLFMCNVHDDIISTICNTHQNSPGANLNLNVFHNQFNEIDCKLRTLHTLIFELRLGSSDQDATIISDNIGYWILFVLLSVYNV